MADIITRLKDIYDKYTALSQKLSDSAVIADTAEWSKLAKEQAELSEPAQKYTEDKNVARRAEQAEGELKTETDPEMRKLLADEAHSCRAQLEELKEDIKIILLPKDKNDERNCIMEIRAGAGGEEAALFAYELYRMYFNYCERHRFRLEEVDKNDTALGGIKEVVLNISGKGAYSRLKF